MPVYAENCLHLRDELRKLDLIIRRRVAAFRAQLRSIPKSAAPHPMYISHEEVDWLLTGDGADAHSLPELAGLDREIQRLQERIDAGVAVSEAQGVFLALPRLARLYGLSPFELQIIVICLAPELERRYDKLYAYLQDDITRKKPSLDLVLDLLCRTERERWLARALLAGPTVLFRGGIIRKSDDPQSPSGSSGLSQFLQLDQRILGFLLGDSSPDGRLLEFVTLAPPHPAMDQVHVDETVKLPLLELCRRHFAGENPRRKKLVFYLRGPYGVGRRELALGICGALNCPLLMLDLEAVMAEEVPKEDILQGTFREGLLQQAAIFIANADAAIKEEGSAGAMLKRLARLSGEYGWLIFLAGEKPWPSKGIFQEALFRTVDLPLPELELRRKAWESALRGNCESNDSVWADHLAARFRLTPGRIREAAELAAMSQGADNPEENGKLAGLFRACRSQSNQRLSDLAVKIEPRYGWDEIVLPDDRIAQLKEICNQVRHHFLVFTEWGFGRKLSHGKGLSVLFSGPSGTGKTMGAEVIARELGLDLYKIDLSRIVSKYIGETEKNLSRVFQEAETSNAVLFFDEADALFGKRTEVSDAHDRYANIETSYLLQKMEEYEGVVILATNLRDNMDEAFTRRIRFIVEFPFPDEPSRSQIWRKHFPMESPVSDEIDYDFLAKRYQIAGGNIRNIVLNAAFMAAADGGVIRMGHILHGTKREFEKIGKLWTDKEQYQSPAARGEGRSI